jgi:hypothetical protein
LYIASIFKWKKREREREKEKWTRQVAYQKKKGGSFRNQKVDPKKIEKKSHKVGDMAFFFLLLIHIF